MNKIKLNKKIAIVCSCLLIVAVAVGVFGITNHNPGTNPPLTTGTSPHTNINSSSSTPSSTSDYTAKVSKIGKNVNSALSDSATTTDKLTSGAIDMETAISRLQNDKAILDKSLSEMQALNPPQNMQHTHSLLVSALQDLDNALSLQISGLKNNDANAIQRSADLINSANSKMNQAKKEGSNQT